MMDGISQLHMMGEISDGEITEVEDVSVPEISALGEITEVDEDVSVLPETSKVVHPRSTDWIHTLNRLNEVLEALPAEVYKAFKAKEDEKSRESAAVRGSDHDHPDMPAASNVTVAHGVARCSCQIDSAVEKEWKRSISWPWKSSKRFNRKPMELLKKYPCLLAIHGRSGDTVLHAAARDGDLKLLVYTCRLFLNHHGNAVNEYVHGDNMIDRKAFFEKENDDQFTAKDCLWFTMAGTTMYAYFENFVKFGRFECSNARRGVRTRKANSWNATLAAMQDEVFEPFYDDNHPVETRLADYANGTYINDNGARVGAKRQMKEIIIKEYNDRKEQLDQHSPTGTRDLIAEYEELRFLLTLSTLSESRMKAVEKEYVRAVIRGCVKEGPDVVKYLFRHRNAKGQTAFHCAHVRYWEMLMKEIPPGEEYKDCFNARDVTGWTALQCAIAQGKDIVAIECLLKDRRVDVNATISKGNGVALHLAIMLHDRVEVVHMLLQRKDTNVNALYINRTKGNGCNIQDSNLGHWTPLQLAVILGRHEIIIALLNHPKVDDPGVQKGKFLWPVGVQLCQNANEEKSNSNQSILSAIHLAGIMGDPQTLRCFLNISKFDLSVTIKGWSALHFVVDGTPLKFRMSRELVRKSHFYGEREDKKYLRTCEDMQKSLTEKDREACISILIQCGLDVWQKNDNNKFPTPGPHIGPEIRHFWQQKLLSEIQDAKNNLNDTGNAVSVVSALVATASYVGPLQPPLGLDSNFVQDQSLLIRIYMVTNTISFYMAVASIMFDVAPSLPMPQEGSYKEWQRSLKTIICAIILLLAAVLNFLISFGAASNVIVSSEYSWQHKGLVFYPTLLGGWLCIIAIGLFYLRLLRLACVKNLTIKCIYQRVYRATQEIDGGEARKYKE